MGRDTVQLETAINTISQEYLLEFTSEYGIPEVLHPKLPSLEDRIVDFPEGKVGVYTKFFEFSNFRLPLSQFLFDILGYYHIYLSQLSVIGAAKQEVGEKYPAVLYEALGLSQKLEQPLFLGGREGIPDCRGLAHECSKRWEAGREYIFHKSRENTRYTPHSHPKTARGATFLSGTKPQILPGGRDMDLFSLIRALNPTKDPATATYSSGVPSTIEKSPLDFANKAGDEDQGTMAPEVPPPEDVPTTRGALEAGQAKRVAATDPSAYPWGESLAAIELGMRSTRPALVLESAPTDVSDPDPLSFADPQSRHPADVAQSSQGNVVAGDPESDNTSFAFMIGSPKIQRKLSPAGGDGVAAATEVRTRRKAAKEADMKKATEDKSMKLSQELENMRTLFSDLQVSNDHLSQQVATLKEQVSGEEKLKAAFEEFKQYEYNWVEQRCAEMDARLDALSIDFDEELYPHMLTAIACRRWMIGHRLHLAVVKCSESLELRQAFADVVSARIAKGMSEGLRHGVEHGQAQLNLEAIEAYDPEAKAKYIVAIQALKNLKYPLVDQLKGLKDAPMDVIMAALYLESDTGDDAPQWVSELHLSSSQLTIPVYPEVRDPVNPWACKEEMLIADAIAANVSHAEKKKNAA
nr:transposase (putative), gypsy type [Tanacetum cinerariifolium]